MGTIKKTPIEYSEDVEYDSTEKKVGNWLIGFFGFIICFTGIGMIIGIPMLIWYGFSNSRVKGAWQGNCPRWCEPILWAQGAEVKQGELACPVCNSQIKVYDYHFYHEEPF